MERKRRHLNERLSGIELKLDRAEQHLVDIQERGMAWVSKQESWKFSSQVNQGERRYVVSMRLAKPIPPVLPLMVDEVVHHLRSSLDHLASYLVEWSGGQVGRAAWPIVNSRFQWEREVERRKRRWQVWRKKGGGPLAGATPAVRAFIEREQPYNRSEKTGDDPLVDLNELWNAEKHRILNPIRVYAVPEGSWRDLFHPSPEIEPVSFKWVLKPRDELKLGTERTLAVLVFPKSQLLPDMEMKGKMPAKVLLGDTEDGRGSLHEDFDLIRRIVTEAVERFPPPKLPSD
jgi:hypothetical protein